MISAPFGVRRQLFQIIWTEGEYFWHMFLETEIVRPLDGVMIHWSKGARGDGNHSRC